MSAKQQVKILFNLYSSNEGKDYEYQRYIPIIFGLLERYGRGIKIAVETGMPEKSKQYLTTLDIVKTTLNRLNRTSRKNSCVGCAYAMEPQLLEGLNKKIKESDVIVTPDTYTLHAGVAFGKFVAVVWGSDISRYIRWMPHTDLALPLLSESNDKAHTIKPQVDSKSFLLSITILIDALLGNLIDIFQAQNKKKVRAYLIMTHDYYALLPHFKNNAALKRICNNLGESLRGFEGYLLPEYQHLFFKKLKLMQRHF